MAKQRPEPVRVVLKAFGERKSTHQEFVAQVERRRRAYQAVVDERSDAAQWESKLYPPYAMQVADTVVANLTADRFRYRVKARPKPGPPQERALRAAGAQALELLLNAERDLDRAYERDRAFLLQNVIAGVTVEKNYWVTEHGTRRSLTVRDDPILDPYGNLIGTTPVLVETEEHAVTRDGPTGEVVDVRDFLWEEAAPNLKYSWVIHRVYKTIEELRQLEQAGVYQNVSDLDQKTDGVKDEFASLEQDLYGEDRAKGRVELLEYWSRDGKRTITVANRKVVLADRPNPFWHGQKPFVVCTTCPDLFRIPGHSLIEKIAQLQEYLWSLMNQRLDNTRLANNAIFMIRDDILDDSTLEFFPGAKWLVPDPQQVQWFTPDTTSSQVSLMAESLAKGDIQNVTGGMPFMSGTQSQTIDQTTATGVSIVTTLAQRMLDTQRQEVAWARERTGFQWASMLQQFVREPRLVAAVGRDGADVFHMIDPVEIQGEYAVRLDVAGESFMRQERRAEAQGMLQTLAQVAPVMQAVGAPLNLRAVVEDYLRAFDVDDVERYFAGQPQPPLAGPAGGQPSPAGDGGFGVTAPQASAATSPSHQTSLSPEVFLQRALAMAGGPRNGG